MRDSATVERNALSRKSAAECSTAPSRSTENPPSPIIQMNASAKPAMNLVRMLIRLTQ